MKSIAIIGVGRVGGALALALDEAGYLVSKLIVRDVHDTDKLAKRIGAELILIDQAFEIEEDIVFITTGDREISGVAKELDRRSANGFLFHTSGVYSSEEMAAARELGYSIGSIHPLISIANAEIGAEQFEDAHFCIEGDADAVEVAGAIVSALKGHSFSIDTNMKSLYHAAAVMACGHLVAVEDVAIEMLADCGIDAQDAKKILMPLVSGTIANLTNLPIEEALTGPFARGDVNTVESHLNAISKLERDDIGEIYRTLAKRSLEIANRRDLSDERSVAIEKLLEE